MKKLLYLLFILIHLSMLNSCFYNKSQSNIKKSPQRGNSSSGLETKNHLEEKNYFDLDGDGFINEKEKPDLLGDDFVDWPSFLLQSKATFIFHGKYLGQPFQSKLLSADIIGNNFENYFLRELFQKGLSNLLKEDLFQTLSLTIPLSENIPNLAQDLFNFKSIKNELFIGEINRWGEFFNPEKIKELLIIDSVEIEIDFSTSKEIKKYFKKVSGVLFWNKNDTHWEFKKEDFGIITLKYNSNVQEYIDFLMTTRTELNLKINSWTVENGIENIKNEIEKKISDFNNLDSLILLTKENIYTTFTHLNKNTEDLFSENQKFKFNHSLKFLRFTSPVINKNLTNNQQSMLIGIELDNSDMDLLNNMTKNQTIIKSKLLQDQSIKTVENINLPRLPDKLNTSIILSLNRTIHKLTTYKKTIQKHFCEWVYDTGNILELSNDIRNFNFINNIFINHQPIHYFIESNDIAIINLSQYQNNKLINRYQIYWRDNFEFNSWFYMAVFKNSYKNLSQFRPFCFGPAHIEQARKYSWVDSVDIDIQYNVIAEFK